jgi:predicted N-acyltransferase
VRQERKAVAAAGLRLRRLTGDDLTPRVWDRFYEFYQNTTCASERAMCFSNSSNSRA